MGRLSYEASMLMEAYLQHIHTAGLDYQYIDIKVYRHAFYCVSLCSKKASKPMNDSFGLMDDVRRTINN